MRDVGVGRFVDEQRRRQAEGCDCRGVGGVAEDHNLAVGRDGFADCVADAFLCGDGGLVGIYTERLTGTYRGG